MSSEVIKTDRVPGIWTGRRRMEKHNCPEYCKPKADFIRHMKKLNRKIRKEKANDT